MSNPFDLLGITADADENAIKSAYAKRLRTTRPDENPQGFQRLNEAYRQALAMQRARASRYDPTTGPKWQQSPEITIHFQAPQADHQAGSPFSSRLRPPAATSRDASTDPNAAAPQPALNFRSFLASYRQHAQATDSRELQAWLASEPGLWHLPTKQSVGHRLLKALFEDPVPTTEACLDATLDFFKLNDALSGVDPIFLNRLKRRCVAEWHIRSDQHSFAFQLYGSASSRNLIELRKFLLQCERPFRWPGSLLRTFRSGGYAKHVAGILLSLCGGHLDDLPKSFDRRHAKFWLEAAAQGLNRTRLIMFALRSAIALVSIPLLGFMIAWPASGGEFDAATVRATLLVTSGITLSIVAIAWLWIGAGWAIGEFDKLTCKSKVARGIRIGFTLALCLASVAIALWMDAAVGTIWAMATLSIATWRFVSRPAMRVRISPIKSLAFVLVVGACFSGLGHASSEAHGPDLLPPLVIAAIALAVWAIDMTRLYGKSFARLKSF